MIFQDLVLLDASPSPSVYEFTSLKSIMDLITNLDLLGGAVWIVWGTIVLASSLKDKNGPGLQSGTWQIVGGLMIMTAVPLFKTMANDVFLLNHVLDLASKFCAFGGALWTIWGVIILAGALRDKTGPGLQSALWQIVGGFLIVVASALFSNIARVVIVTQ